MHVLRPGSYHCPMWIFSSSVPWCTLAILTLELVPVCLGPLGGVVADGCAALQGPSPRTHLGLGNRKPTQRQSYKLGNRKPEKKLEVRKPETEGPPKDS